MLCSRRVSLPLPIGHAVLDLPALSQQRVGNAEWEVERDDASRASEQLVEQLLRAPARRVVREEPRVHAGRVDAVRAPGRRVRGDRDDLPPLVARALRCAEVDADDHNDLARATKQGPSVNMTLRFSPLPLTWSRAILSTCSVFPPPEAGEGPRAEGIGEPARAAIVVGASRGNAA